MNSTYEIAPASVREQKNALRRETAAWQRAAFGLLAASVVINAAQVATISRLEDANRETVAQLQQAERTRDYAIQQLGAAVLQAEQDKRGRAAFALACEAAGTYQYVGACIITAYCPCAECCGAYADGLTATGIPAGPGIVAVDPDVIELGSTVIIDGQRYLAADTGVTGNHVDLYMDTHEAAEDFGVRTADVWTEVRP